MPNEPATPEPHAFAIAVRIFDTGVSAVVRRDGRGDADHHVTDNLPAMWDDLRPYFTGEEEPVPGPTDVPELTPDELDELWTLLAAVRLDGELSDYLLRDEIEALESTVDKIRAWRRSRGFRMEWLEADDPAGTPYTWHPVPGPTDVPDADAR